VSKQKDKHRLVIVDNHFGTRKVFEELFSSVEVFNKHTKLTNKDVVVFEGGVDIGAWMYSDKPSSFTQQPNFHRDEIEQTIYELAMKAGAGCIGICRGAQLITALNGGKLFQHVNGHTGTPHLMTTSDGDEIRTSSAHHQMMNPFVLDQKKYKLLAWSSEPLSDVYLDGHDRTEFVPDVEPEVVLYPGTKSLCIQGHPEWMQQDSGMHLYCRELVSEYLLKAKAA